MNEHDATEAAYRNGYAAGYAAAKADKWISVKDRLPTPEQSRDEYGRLKPLLAYGIIGEGEFARRDVFAMYFDGKRWCVQYAYDTNVFYWQTMPEPPEERGGRHARLHNAYADRA